MVKTTITRTVEINLDIAEAAQWFAALDDDAMCRFLVAVAAESEKYEGLPDSQWYYLGGHLKNCHCSNESTREMLRAWVYWMEHSGHGEDGR